MLFSKLGGLGGKILPFGWKKKKFRIKRKNSLRLFPKKKTF